MAASHLQVHKIDKDGADRNRQANTGTVTIAPSGSGSGRFCGDGCDGWFQKKSSSVSSRNEHSVKRERLQTSMTRATDDAENEK